MDRGVELIQIRERSLPTRQLAELTRKALALNNRHGTRILVNDRADVALACGAHGVHLRDGSVSPSLFARENFLVTVACHDLSRIEDTAGADFILLAPIFAPRSKDSGTTPLGVEAIRRACGLTRIPVLALGGITEANALECVAAGAAGIAAISYFEEKDRACV
jgi:thiamine-phosphate pyrophosphorylase